MTYIHVQKLVKDKDGKIVSGSAAVMESIYRPNEGDPKKGHSIHRQKEKLGKVVWLSEDRRVGVFRSPTRGLVEYDADDDAFSEVEPEDPRLSGSGLFQEPQRHVTFGDAYIVLGVMHGCGYLSVIRGLFSSDEEFQRLLAHVVAKVMKNGNRAPMDVRVNNSFLSYLIPSVPLDSLRSDTRFFTMMGDDRVKVRFFRSFVQMMRRTAPGFGTGCYIDTTPLPNDIENNPFNALSSHGVGAVGIQTRLALIVDDITGLPIWFEIVPGNILDFQTLKQHMEDVKECMDIEIRDFVLDAGYVSQEMICAFDIPEAEGNGRTFAARMPAKRGYPFRELYSQNRKMFSNGKYSFEREGHMYFGIRREVEIFGHMEYAYVYLDKNNAVNLLAEWMKDEGHRKEYDGLTDREKTWYGFRFGFFVLVSNQDASPEEMLSRYFDRMTIESGFKTIKEYLELLPLCKWNEVTIRGKILCDTICHIVFSKLREHAKGTPLSVNEMLGNGQGLICLKRSDGMVSVDSPTRQAKEAFAACDLTIPTSFGLDDYVIEKGI